MIEKIKKFLEKFKDTTDMSAILPDAIVLVSNKGEFIWTNDVADKFLSSIKSGFEQVYIDDILENAMDCVRRISETGKSTVLRTKASLKNDMFIEVTSRKSEEGFVVSMRDTTQNYKTLTSILVEHESSKKINRDKNTFFAKLSNEFKMPLQSIIGFSQAMIDGMGGEMSEKQDKYVRIINKNSVELFYFIDKVLELSKTESNLYQHDFQYFDVESLLQNIIKVNEKAVLEKNLTISQTIEDNVKRKIYSDEESLKIVLQNIIETCIKMTDVGSISVELTHPELDFVNEKGLVPFENASEKSFLMFKITDTGVGMNSEELENLFEPYIQLDNPNKKNIVRSIAFASIRNVVKMLKGNMWVDSESMKGASYNLIIPIEKGMQSSNE